jgi:hypothetical protein
MTRVKNQGPTQRWAQGRSDNALDAELGEVFRTVAEEAPLSDAALARVGRRLRSSGERRGRSLLRLVPIGVAVLVGGSGAALAQWAKPGIWDTRSWFQTEAPRAPRPAPSSAPRPRPPSGVETSPVLPAPEGPAPATFPSARIPEPSTAGPSGVALESELVQRALERLRRDHDGVTALKLLDEHRERFPAGLLTLEATVARVDALLLLGRRAEALQQLSRLPLERVGRRTELQLLRAELNAERDCSRALSDFDAVLATPAPAGLTERGLYGRANCRLRLGDAAGSRADLDRYLSEFPEGRFAARIRARSPSRGTF